MRVLELGCGQGDLLAALRPSRGVGIDLSERMLDRARARHGQLTFVHADVHEFLLREKFDFIILSDLVNDIWDVQRILELVAQQLSPVDSRGAELLQPPVEFPRKLAKC